MQLITKIIVSQLPESPWWNCGVPAYPHNWMMTEGAVPNGERVVEEHWRCLSELRALTDVLYVPFPPEFDYPEEPRHAFVFVHDSFISNRYGDVVLSNFAVRERQLEAELIGVFLAQHGYRMWRLAKQEIAEGGEFHWVPYERLLFAGVCRNNEVGAMAVTRQLGATKVCIIETDAFHVDTVFCPLLDVRGRLCGALAALALIKNADDVVDFLEERETPVFELVPEDAIGTPDTPGSLAVNLFTDAGRQRWRRAVPDARDRRPHRRFGILHIMSPVSQFHISGGGVHCLPNEL
jgi:N-dimethylarginine dimethylaminohydrolase